MNDVDCFDAEFFGIPSVEADWMDPQHRVLMETLYHAVGTVQGAGRDIGVLSKIDRNSVCLSNLVFNILETTFLNPQVLWHVS